VTNCDSLKTWLGSEGHQVRSDNDGEMVVHTIEHAFARELAARPELERDHDHRRGCMRRAIRSAAKQLIGSYAAVVVDPVSKVCWAIKQGSSLYFGVGQDETGGAFGLASSDLSAVLKFTRALVSIVEGEVVEYDASKFQVFHVADDSDPEDRTPVRSRLRAQDTALVPPFTTFMEQEIAAQETTCDDVIRLHLGGSDALRIIEPALASLGEDRTANLYGLVEDLRSKYEEQDIRDTFDKIVHHEDIASISKALSESDRAALSEPHRSHPLVSEEAALFTDLRNSSHRGEAINPGSKDDGQRLTTQIMDALLELEEVTEYTVASGRFSKFVDDTTRRGGRILVVCCGSSLNAALAGALFFHEVAGVEILPVLPGEFRGRFSETLRDGDLIIAISQSGETKDLIDVLNDVTATGRDIRRVGLVNNVNSTLAQEKSDLLIPLRCGPEVAVPATKSYMNQMTVLLALALRVGRSRAQAEGDPARRAELERALSDHESRFTRIPSLIRETNECTRDAIEEAAHLLYLTPSIHILATRITSVAKEGALKVREVVLNHTEGFEGSEFKHGPNTILGWNTVLGPTQVDALLRRLGSDLQALLHRASLDQIPTDDYPQIVQAALDSVFNPRAPEVALNAIHQTLVRETVQHGPLLDALYADYPLIYVTGPDPRDVHLTVSQINTHKIRGSSTVVIAEDQPDLRQAASRPPSDGDGYRHVYIPLPRTGDTILTNFSAIVALQSLALKMSLMKAAWLDRLGAKDHGVHPDVPKNVSKSITVD